MVNATILHLKRFAQAEQCRFGKPRRCFCLLKIRLAAQGVGEVIFSPFRVFIYIAQAGVP